jgi:hypothetical protein
MGKNKAGMFHNQLYQHCGAQQSPVVSDPMVTIVQLLVSPASCFHFLLVSNLPDALRRWRSTAYLAFEPLRSSQAWLSVLCAA